MNAYMAYIQKTFSDLTDEEGTDLAEGLISYQLKEELHELMPDHEMAESITDILEHISAESPEGYQAAYPPHTI